ncbi:unnamed protein product [Leptosia nina]|uniref:Uncharacterized protein n=1 Tax=Leptosia nina TaxID=320188 RepID=A0AAV1J9I1_9NEOP
MFEQRRFVMCYVINVLIHVNTAGGSCDGFTVQIEDLANVDKLLPMNNSIVTYINASADQMNTCKYIRVYLDLDKPGCGRRYVKANFTLGFKDAPEMLPQTAVDPGVIAGAVLGAACAAIVGFYAYTAINNLMQSNVYRLPPSPAEALQFKCL